MRNAIVGIAVALVLMALGVFVVLRLGFVPTNADATPSSLEQRLGMQALDASIERRAPRTANPVPASDDNLIAGMKIYTMNCAVCHGDLDLKASPLAHAFYPPPPQLVLDPMDDPEWHIYYAIRTGVRYTGMPAWAKALDTNDMWKVTAFLSRVDHLPPAARDYWANAFHVTPPGGGAGSRDR